MHIHVHIPNVESVANTVKGHYYLQYVMQFIHSYALSTISESAHVHSKDYDRTVVLGV